MRYFLSDCVQDYVDEEPGNANSFMFINGDFYIKTPLRENGCVEDPFIHNSYVIDDIQPIIEWLRTPLCSCSAQEGKSRDGESAIVTDAKQQANVSLTDSIRDPSSATQLPKLGGVHDNSGSGTTSSSNLSAIASSSNSSSIKSGPLIGKKRNRISCFADQARLVLRTTEGDVPTAGKKLLRRTPVPDSSRNQALLEGIIERLPISS